MIVERPWGEYEELAHGVGWRVKRLTVDPKLRFSLQYHKSRSEYWIITKGKGMATIGQRHRLLRPGTMIYVPVGVQHRVENKLDEPLEFIEIQMGDVLSEEDIVRLEDDFGRIPEAQL